MAIPAYTIDGVLPPYLGPVGPGGAPAEMTPYVASSLEVVTHFGITARRQEILRGWLAHREQLRLCGVIDGFQWMDGSFVEDKVPADVDVVTFMKRPARTNGPAAVERMMRANPNVFTRRHAKATFSVDAFFVDLDGTKKGLVELTRYYLGLFSHRRGDDLWKGMLKVDLDPPQDALALEWLDHHPILAPLGAV